MDIHISLPGKLIEEIDRFVLKGERSQFIREALRTKLKREALGRALKATAGILNPTDYPYWDTPEKTSAWVRAIRNNDEETLRKLGYLHVP